MRSLARRALDLGWAHPCMQITSEHCLGDEVVSFLQPWMMMSTLSTCVTRCAGTEGVCRLLQHCWAGSFSIGAVTGGY